MYRPCVQSQKRSTITRVLRYLVLLYSIDLLQIRVGAGFARAQLNQKNLICKRSTLYSILRNSQNVLRYIGDITQPNFTDTLLVIWAGCSFVYSSAL